MPIYTYRCTACGIEFDQHQHFSDPPLKKCPKCGRSSLRKVITPAGIIFKGHGWYATDHRSPSGNAQMKKEKGNGSSEKKDTVPEGETKDKASEAKSGSDSGTTKSK